MTGAPPTVRVLHVDDEPGFVDMAAQFLERADDRLSVETATSAAAGLDRIADGEFDCVVSDYDMPGQNGIEFLRAVREESPDLPFILFTGKGSEAVASDAVSAGVTDYLQKEGGTDQYTVLANRIGNVVEGARARRELRRKERRYQAVFNDPNILVALTDTDGAILDINQTALEYVDATPETVTGELLPETPWFDDAPAARQELRAGIDRAAGGEYVEFETDLPSSGGEPYTVQGVIRPVTEGGEVVSLLVSSRDVTRRANRERELRQYEAYLEESTDVITVLDESGQIAYESPAVERILGYEPGSLIDEDGFDYIHPDDVEDVLAAFADLVSEPGATVTVECRFRTADDAWCWLEVRGTNQLENDAINGVVTNSRDITGRKEREREIQRERDRFRAVFEESIGAMVIADDEGRYVEVNQSATELFGLPEEELLGRSIGEFALEGFDFETAWRDFHQAENEQGTFPIVRPDGTERIVEYAATANVTPGRHLSVLRDVTERERRNRELERQNDRLEEFAAIVSHDLRNPLNVAEGRLELAREDPDGDHVDAVEDALGRMERIVEDMLWLASEGRDIGSTESVDLRELAEHAWAMVADDTRAELVVEGDLGAVEADRDRLCQLLENLFGNAVEHGSTSPPSDAREDALEHASAGVTVTVGVLDDGFYVEDDGPGVPAEQRDRVFDAGYSTCEAGTGFGLRIAEQIVEAHGWTIRVTDGAAGGARFEVTGVAGA